MSPSPHPPRGVLPFVVRGGTALLVLAGCGGATDADPVTIATCNASSEGENYRVFGRASRPAATITATLLDRTASGRGTVTVDAPIPLFTRSPQVHSFVCGTADSSVDGQITQPSDPEPSVILEGELVLGVESELQLHISDEGDNAGLTGEAIVQLEDFEPETTSFLLSGTAQTLVVRGTARSLSVTGTATILDGAGAITVELDPVVRENAGPAPPVGSPGR